MMETKQAKETKEFVFKHLETRQMKGITLIALVITIIVLLILAGVTIATLTGENGILTRASDAKEKTQNSTIEEQRKLAMLNAKLNNENQIYTDKNGDIAIIPAGFAQTGIEGEDVIDSGLVIIDSVGNEYVWIPVEDINSMAMCEQNNQNSICNLSIQDDGSLMCLTHNSTNFVGRIYDVESFKQDFTQKDQVYSRTEGYHEPDIITLFDNDSNMDYLQLAGVSTASQLEEQLKNDFYNMVISVEKNKGFYISRYEIGENATSQKNQKVLTSTMSNGESYIGANTWYGLYKVLRDTEKVSTNGHMIWGCQYDQVIKFIGEEAQTAHEDRQATIQHNTGYDGDKDILKNIYDLEGNNVEWTAMASHQSNRAVRGSHYYDASMGNIYPASNQFGVDPTTTSIRYTSRQTLYIK